MKIIAKLFLPQAVFLSVLLISAGVISNASFAQEEDFFSEDEAFAEDEDFDFEAEVEETPALPSEKKKAAASEEESEDFSDANFETNGEISFEDFESEPAADTLVNESFDDLPQGPAEFELEPLDSTEPQQIESYTEPFEEAPPIIEEEIPVETVGPIITTPAEEPEIQEPIAITSFEPGPDLELEAKLHDIYVNFHSNSIPKDQWEMVTSGRQSDIYNIQSGDNLWDVSKTLFYDGNYWPKIWSLNKNIQNPHIIEPGDQLQFVMGSEAEPPSFTVGEYREEVQEVNYEPKLVIPAGSNTEIEIPPPLVEPRPILKNPPPSLPEWKLYQADGYDDAGISIEKRPVLKLNPEIYLTSFVSEDNSEVIGSLKEIEGDTKTATDFQYIYLLIEKGKAQPGDYVLITQTKDKIQPSGNYIEPRPEGFGREVQIQGHARIESPVAIKESVRDDYENYDLFRAMIEKSIANVKVNAEIRPGRLLMVDLDAKGPRSQVVSQIVGGIFDEDRKIFGDQNIVFLNRGSNDGLEAGHILPVRQNLKVENSDSIVGENIKPIGFIKVVKVSPNLSTAIVVKAWQDIQAGDLTGQGQLLSSAESFDPAESNSKDSLLIEDDIESEFGSSKASVEMIPAEKEEDGLFDPLDEEFIE